MIKNSEEYIDGFLEDLDRPNINSCDLEFKNFFDLDLILKNMDIQTKRPKFKRSKKQELKEIIRLAKLHKV